MNTKFLVFGLGFLGSYILNEVKNSGMDGYGTHLKSRNSKYQVDVRNTNSVSDCIKKINPNFVINCVAIGKIDFLEKNPQLAYSINAEGAKNIAKSCRHEKIRMIHISTDSVFDGKKSLYTEEDTPNPLNVYAKSKFLSEKYVSENCDDYVIIRTNFYGYDQRGNWFLNWILKTLENNQQITGFTDLFWNPIEVSNLSRLIIELSMTKYSGLIHLSSDEIITKYQFISKVDEVFNFDPNLIKKGTYQQDAKVVAQRPTNTTLSNKKAVKLLKAPILPIDESLKKLRNYIISLKKQ